MKAPKLFSFDDFSTGLNTFDSIFADVSNPVDRNFGMKSAQAANNVLMTKSGLEKMLGFVAYLTNAISGNPTITGLYRYSKTGSGGSTEWIVTAGTKVYTAGGNAVTEIHSGITSGAYMNFCTFNNVVIMTNGIDAPLYYDGVTCAAISFTDPSNIFTNSGGVDVAKPKFATVFRNRIFYGGDPSLPHRLWTPRPGTHDNFNNSTSLVDSFDVSVGDGYKLTWAKAISKDLLVIYKEGSILRLSGSAPFGASTDAFRIEEVSRDIGCKAGRSVVQVGSDHLFVSENGIKRLGLVQEYGDVAGVDITDAIPDEVADWNGSALENAFGVYVKPEKQVWFHIPAGSSSENDTVYVYDMRTNAIMPREGISASCGAMIGDTYYTGGYDDGQIYQQLSSNAYAGDAIESSWETKWLPIGGLFNKKVFQNLLIYFENPGNATLTVQWQIMKMDGSVATGNKSSAATTNDVFDTGLWDTAVFDAGQDAVFKKNNLGRGRAIKLKIINNNANERWKVRKIEFTVRNLGHVGA